MVARTAWSPGTLAAGFTAAFNPADLNSLAQLSSVMSGIAFDNTTALDQFMDISFVGAFASAQTVGAGAGIGMWLYTLAHDGTTYGSGRLVAGTQLAFSPMLNPIGGIPLEPLAGVTTFAGSNLGLALPPEAFRLVLQNQTGFAFAAGGACSCQIKTYRQNTNA